MAFISNPGRYSFSPDGGFTHHIKTRLFFRLKHFIVEMLLLQEKC